MSCITIPPPPATGSFAFGFGRNCTLRSLGAFLRARISAKNASRPVTCFFATLAWRSPPRPAAIPLKSADGPALLTWTVGSVDSMTGGGGRLAMIGGGPRSGGGGGATAAGERRGGGGAPLPPLDAVRFAIDDSGGGALSGSAAGGV